MNWGSSKLINESLLTFDCEWAPNFILEHVSNLLIESEVKSTWFVTNESAIIEEDQGRRRRAKAVATVR